jgi:hypothetical protein
MYDKSDFSIRQVYKALIRHLYAHKVVVSRMTTQDDNQTSFPLNECIFQSMVRDLKWYDNVDDLTPNAPGPKFNLKFEIQTLDHADDEVVLYLADHQATPLEERLHTFSRWIQEQNEKQYMYVALATWTDLVSKQVYVIDRSLHKKELDAWNYVMRIDHNNHGAYGTFDKRVEAIEASSSV